MAHPCSQHMYGTDAFAHCLWCNSWWTSLWPLNHLQLFSSSKGAPCAVGTQCVGAMQPPQQEEFLPLGDVSKCLQGSVVCPARPACLEGLQLNSSLISLSCLPSHSLSSEGPSSRHYGQKHQPSLSGATRLQLPARNLLQCLFQLFCFLYSRSYLINVKSSFLKTVLLMALVHTVCLARGKSM